MKDNNNLSERIEIGYIALAQNDSSGNKDVHFYSPQRGWICKFIPQTSVVYTSLITSGNATDAISGTIGIEKSGISCILNIDASITFGTADSGVLVATFPDGHVPRMARNVITHPHGDLSTSVTLILKSDGIYAYVTKAGTHNVRATIPYFIAG